MNLQRMRRAELIVLVEQLNEARDHTDRVIDGLRVENNRLAADYAELECEVQNMRRTQRTPITGRARDASLVHTFNPDVPGSFAQATQRAREQGGVVRRTQS